MTLHVESKIEIDPRSLPVKVAKEIKKSCSYKDPLYAMRRAQGLSTEGLTKRLKTYDEADGRLLVWRGALGRVVRTLKRSGIPYKIVDRRLKLPKIDLTCSVSLRDYQVPPCRVMRKRQQTIGQGPAGSGKTEMLLYVIAKFRQPTLVLVWQESQQRTWLERIPRYFGFEPGGIGGRFKSPVLAQITVGLAQSVRTRMDDLRGRFGCVVCDEVQRFAAPTLSEVVNNLPAAVRLGASDDERRRDMREFLLYDTFGPKGWKLPHDAGQCPVDVYLVPTAFEYSGGDYYPGEWPFVINELTTDEDRNDLVADITRMEVNSGSRVLIWSDRVGHCRGLQGRFNVIGIKAGLLLGTPQMRKEKDRTHRGLEDGTVEVGLGTTVAEQSVNIPPLDVGIMTCASADQRLLRFKQMRGRLARPHEGKERSRLYYLWDINVPGLMKKIRNIRRRYNYRVVRLVQLKESTMPEERVAITVQTLKAGCKQLKIKYPKGATQKKLEKLIQQALAKDKTFGAHACGACFRDITIDIDPCPWCQSKFRPTEDEEPEEEIEGVEDETEGEEPEDSEAGEEPEEGEEGEVFYTTEKAKKEVEWDEDGMPTNHKEETEDGFPVVYDADGAAYIVDEQGDLEKIEDEDDGEEGEPEEEPEDEEPEEDDGEDGGEEDPDDLGEEIAEDEEPEEEEPEDEPPPKPKKKRTKKTGKSTKEQKKAELEAKRKQIKSELPYTKKQLVAMKRQVLVMIAGVLGAKDPIKIGSAEKLVSVILKRQEKKGLVAKPTTTKKTAKVAKKIRRRK